MKNKKLRILVKGLILVWLLVLSKFILFKKFPGYYKRYFLSERVREAALRENKNNNNYRLFATIRRFSESTHIRKDYVTDNIGGNIIGFLPLGFLIPFLLRGKARGIKTILLVFGISLFFEVTQLKTGWGVFDVDDLFLNTTGGLAGLILYYGFRLLTREKTQPAI